MATNTVAPTPEELEEQFPFTTRPFAVLYCPECDANQTWGVNNEKGDTSQAFGDMATALKAAAEMGAEWDAEAKMQAQALAKVIEADGLLTHATITQRAGDFCICLDAFFGLAQREIENHNDTDWDKIGFLVDAAKAEMCKFSSFVCEVESEVQHA